MEFPQISTEDIKEVVLELCNPQKETIGILGEAYDINLSIIAMKMNVLEFKIPILIDINGKLLDNPHLPDMKPYYLIRLKIGKNYEEYFRITKPKNEGGKEDYNYYYCLSYISTLADRQLISYSSVSYTLDEVFNGKEDTIGDDGKIIKGQEGILKNTNWKIGYISSVFTTMRRSVESGTTNILDFILDNLTNSYNCLPIFDTRTNEISIYSPEEISKDTGLVFSYKKYIETFNLEIDPITEFTTRLNVRGKDGLSIHEVTPSGQPYLENFSYFMYGFEHDEHGNVINSSPFFSDSLCKAQMLYEDLLAQKEGEFTDLLAQKSSLRKERATKETEAFNILTSLHRSEDITTVLFGMTNAYYRCDNFLTSKNYELNIEDNYAILGRFRNITLEIDGITSSLPPATAWGLIDKIKSKDNVGIKATSMAEDIESDMVIVKITEDEFYDEENEDLLIAKYCVLKNQEEYNNKLHEIAEINEQLDAIDLNIAQLRIDLSEEANFSRELIEERNNYIIEKTFENNSITDPQDLLDVATEYFETINSPALVLEIDIVNFTEIAMGDADKLFRTSLNPGLYNWITVYYEPHNVNVECMIMEINLDVENSKLSFVLSNVKELLTREQIALKDLYRTSSAATSILQEKYKWDSAIETATEIEQILRQTWDAAARDIKSGVNNSVVLDRRGITITDPTDDMRVIRLVAGWIGLSADGGNTFKTAINASGIYGQEIIGQIIAGEQLKIVNETGTFEVNQTGVTIGIDGLNIPEGIPNELIQSADTWDEKVDRKEHDELAENVVANTEDLSAFKIYFRFDEEGFRIGRIGDISQILIDNKAIQFLNVGGEKQEEPELHPQAIAYIHGDKMYIKNVEATRSLLVGVHEIRRHKNTDVTLIQWVGSDK